MIDKKHSCSSSSFLDTREEGGGGEKESSSPDHWKKSIPINHVIIFKLKNKPIEYSYNHHIHVHTLSLSLFRSPYAYRTAEVQE